LIIRALEIEFDKRRNPGLVGQDVLEVLSRKFGGGSCNLGVQFGDCAESALAGGTNHKITVVRLIGGALRKTLLVRVIGVLAVAQEDAQGISALWRA
jgi:hypothetical protein